MVGGPHGDCGLTGRKIIVDTYGGWGRHGGGAFSGKDPTKVDRSAAYMARHVAKNIVAAGLADRCEVQLAYAIGVSEPVSVHVDTEGTGKVDDERICEVVRELFPLTPRGIIEYLDLRRPIYPQDGRGRPLRPQRAGVHLGEHERGREARRNGPCASRRGVADARRSLDVFSHGSVGGANANWMRNTDSLAADSLSSRLRTATVIAVWGTLVGGVLLLVVRRLGGAFTCAALQRRIGIGRIGVGGNGAIGELVDCQPFSRYAPTVERHRRLDPVVGRCGGRRRAQPIEELNGRAGAALGNAGPAGRDGEPESEACPVLSSIRPDAPPSVRVGLPTATI